MKIAIVVHDLKGGGAEKMMVRLANGLAKQGQDVNLVLLTAGGINRKHVSESVELTELNSSRTATSALNLRKHLKQTKPDRIISALTHVNVIAVIACFTLGILKKLYVSERNAFSRDKLVSNEPLIKTAYAVAPLLYRLLPNPVICVSQGVADDLVETTVVDKTSVTTALNPVLEDDYLTTQVGLPSHEWLQDKTVPTIVAVGRLAPQKGFDLLLHALAKVNQTNRARLIIYGEGEGRTELENLVSELGLQDSVRLPGYAEFPLNEMGNADLYVLSSRFEGSPNALVEAMSTGVSVIATDCPHGPKEIFGDALSHRLCRLSDSDDLADKIVCYLGKLHDKDIQLKLASRYTTSSASQSYLSVIEVNA